MALVEMKVRLTGVSPLIMSNSQMAMPSNPIAKRISSIVSKGKKKMTEEDEMEKLELQFMGSSYQMQNGKGKVVCLPSNNLEGFISDGATNQRLGKRFKSAVFCMEDCPLIFDGPKSIEALWKAREQFALIVPVKMGNGLVPKARPIFRQWAVDVTYHWNNDIVDLDQVKDALVFAGRQCGIGDWTPKHGRCEVEFLS